MKTYLVILLAKRMKNTGFLRSVAHRVKPCKYVFRARKNRRLVPFRRAMFFVKNFRTLKAEYFITPEV